MLDGVCGPVACFLSACSGRVKHVSRKASFSRVGRADNDADTASRVGVHDSAGRKPPMYVRQAGPCGHGTRDGAARERPAVTTVVTTFIAPAHPGARHPIRMMTLGLRFPILAVQSPRVPTGRSWDCDR